jgi:hypothetical protein
MNKPDNPPAFPIHWENHSEGMTLRDYFAAKAIEGATVSAASNVRFNHALIAEEAYLLADAMLKAREQ